MNKNVKNSLKWAIRPNRPNRPGSRNNVDLGKIGGEKMGQKRLTQRTQRSAVNLAEMSLVIARAGALGLTDTDLCMVQHYLLDVLSHVRAAAKVRHVEIIKEDR